ncbi:MAG TPA: DEAD/DEAH box helicase [Acidobacteriota bacterium]|nr:DEAD/DEAH box helicase [Acidobacteriota bacterium]
MSRTREIQNDSPQPLDQLVKRDSASLAVQRMEKTLSRFKRLQRRGEITEWVKIDAKPGSYRDIPESMPQPIQDALQARGIQRLYSHQAQAFQRVQAGRNIVVVTPTASGKTLCYNLPVVSRILEEPQARALYLFPTKALAQDQMAELQELIAAGAERLGVNTYDGDTPADMRQKIRKKAQIILTNPDMLHTALLPHHPKWIQLFQNLKYVVVDELHTYRGIFGSHVANVFRRLKRIARFYNSEIQFICASATIANPQELAQKLLEEPVELIDDNGAPQASKELIFYNPPIVNADLGLRRGALSSARRFAEEFLKNNIQTLVFASSRVNVEVLLSYLQNTFHKHPAHAEKVRGYRGGYLPKTRREIERQLRNREILGVVSTNALELGIDIGSLEAVVLAGYPGSVASTWQQMGRAGRRSGHSAAVLVARNLPIDQFIVQNAEYFFGRSPEHGLIHPDNLQILVSHIKCAAFELPLQRGEEFGGEDLEEILEFLSEQGTLHPSGDSWHWTDEAYPANSVSLRNIAEENFVVFNLDQNNRAIAEVDFDSAPELIHEDAIYMCEGLQYHVEHLDYDGRKAYVREVEVDYYTDAISYSGLSILRSDDSLERAGCEVAHGEVHIAQKHPGFKKIRFYTGENLGFGKIELPLHELHTTSYWVTAPESHFNGLGLNRDQIITGFLGIAHAMHHLATVILMCDVRDLGRSVGDRGNSWFARSTLEGLGFYSAQGEPYDVDSRFLDAFDPTIFIHDKFPGGVGLAEKLFENHDRLLAQVHELIEHCGCEEGCPSCVGPVDELGKNTRRIALAVLGRLRGIAAEVQAVGGT